ncbi:MAG TPA: amidohydrolase family protein, partial [Burkholderiales bacterium]|nr:amidohydrolase family protein [Burkholderiales bacterium]
MQVVDTQVHIWAADTPQRPWPKRHQPHRAEPLGKDELLREMDKAGVDRVIIVPPSWEGDRNDIALAAAAAHPNRFAVMGRLDPLDPGSRGCLKTWRDQPGMLGLRFTFHTPALMPLLTEGHMEWVWDEAEQAGVPIYVLVRHPLVHLIDRVAERHPGLKLVMDHLSMPADKKGAAAFAEFDKVLAIAKRANVAAKASGMPRYSDEPYPHPSLHRYLRQAYDAFGPRRLFWGTDITRTPITYRQHVT